MMNTLGLANEILKAYSNGIVLQTDGISVWELDEEQKKRISMFEEERGVHIYHVIHQTYIDFGNTMEMETYLLLPNDIYDRDEVEYFEEGIDQGYIYTYVYNVDKPDYSEYGAIGFAVTDGLISRTDMTPIIPDVEKERGVGRKKIR